jgi:hypothetical protein
LYSKDKRRLFMKGGEAGHIVQTELREPKRSDTHAEIMGNAGIEQSIHEHTILDEVRQGQ